MVGHEVGIVYDGALAIFLTRTAMNRRGDGAVRAGSQGRVEREMSTSQTMDTSQFRAIADHACS